MPTSVFVETTIENKKLIHGLYLVESKDSNEGLILSGVNPSHCQLYGVKIWQMTQQNVFVS